MTESQREQWAVALESGKYQQTFGVLKDTKGYCCLGIANELFGFGLRDDNWTGDPLPYEFLDRDSQFDLAIDNDNGKTFVEIAQKVRRIPVSQT